MNNDWIIWNGGDCPVAPDTIVQTQFRYQSRPYRYAGANNQRRLTMIVLASMRHFKSLKAQQNGDAAGLAIYGERPLETIEVTMPLSLAEMIEEAFHAYEDWESGQEGPTFDDALAAKCDADARVEEARALK